MGLKNVENCIAVHLDVHLETSSVTLMCKESASSWTCNISFLLTKLTHCKTNEDCYAQ